MVAIVVVTPAALLIARRISTVRGWIEAPLFCECCHRSGGSRYRDRLSNRRPRIRLLAAARQGVRL